MYCFIVLEKNKNKIKKKKKKNVARFRVAYGIQKLEVEP